MAEQSSLVTSRAPLNNPPNPRSRPSGHRGFYMGIGAVSLAVAVIVVSATHRFGGLRTAGILQKATQGNRQETYARKNAATSAGKPQKSAQPFAPQKLVDLASPSTSATPNPAPRPNDVKSEGTERRNHGSRRHVKSTKKSPTEFKPVIPQLPNLTSSVPKPPVLTLPPKKDWSSSQWQQDPPPYSPPKEKKHRSLRKLLIGSD